MSNILRRSKRKRPNHPQPDLQAAAPVSSSLPTTSSSTTTLTTAPVRMSSLPAMPSPSTCTITTSHGSTTSTTNLASGTSAGFCFSQPSQYIINVSDGIGDNVSNSIKTKIMAGEYIDLAILLTNSNATNMQDQQKIAFVNGELILQPKQNTPKITTIENWTDAFIIFMNIYCSIHVEKFPQLLKYLYTIRLGAKRSAFGWKSYDEQFRLRLATNPTLSWANIDQELWLLYMHGNGGNQPTGINKVLRCYAYNYNGQCVNQNCKYSHSCLRCFGQHPVMNCPRQNARIIPSMEFGQRQFRPPTQRMGFRPRVFNNRFRY